MAYGAPRPWGQIPPYALTLETEGEERSLGLEKEGWSCGGGKEGAPWRPNGWEELGGPQRPLKMEGSGVCYGVSSDMGGIGRPWLPPREEEEGSCGGAINRGPQELPWEFSLPEQEGRRGSCEPERKVVQSPPVGGWQRVRLSPPREDSCEPPQRRVWSPPMGEWLRVPLSPPRVESWESPQKRVWSPPMDGGWRVPPSPPRERGLTSPGSQRQPRALSRHATRRGPSPRSSRRDSPSNGDSPRAPRGRRDGPAVESRKRSRESPQPAWESCCDLGTPPPASRRAMERRDSDRSRGLEELGGNSSSGRCHRSRRDPTWETRHGSYSVKAGRNRDDWSGRGFQSFQRQVDSRERDNRRLKGSHDEDTVRDKGLSRDDRGHSVGSPRKSIPQKDQGAKESFQRNFRGPKGGAKKRYEGHGRQTAATGRFFPRMEVVNYWKKGNHKSLSFCPRPYIPDGSSKPPILNPNLKQLMAKHALPLFSSTRYSIESQRDVLNMVAPAMALYETAEAAIKRKEGVDPLAVRQLARTLLGFAGKANRRLTAQRSWQVIKAIDPRLTSLMPRKSGQILGGRLFAGNDVPILKKAICSLPKLPEEPPERDFDNRQEERKPTLISSRPESPPPLQDGSVSSEMRSGQQVQHQDEASLELWHRRFGHADSAAILRLQNDNLAIGIKINPDEADNTARCLPCLEVKGNETTFFLDTVNRSTTFMDLIHCELSGPVNVPSLRHQRYVLMFVDDYSRYCVTFLLKKTSEIHEYFQRYLTRLRERYKFEPKAFQMNSASDSVSPLTLRFLEEQGIWYNRRVECIPGQCGTAEREMKSLLEMTQCMLADANLPGPFWGYAILAATYLWNRLAFSHMKRTPFQARSGKVPFVNHIRVFGSLVRNRENQNDHTQRIYIGYTLSQASYTVMNLETGMVSSEVGLDFDERQGVEKGGIFLATFERHGCGIEILAGTGVSMMPQTLRVMRLEHNDKDVNPDHPIQWL